MRTLWGNDTEALRLARSPGYVADLLAREGLPFARVHMAQEQPPEGGTWLRKSIHGAGGSGTYILTAQPRSWKRRRDSYCQQFIEGESCSAVFIGDGRTARFAGATRQLVGVRWDFQQNQALKFELIHDRNFATTHVTGVEIQWSAMFR